MNNDVFIKQTNIFNYENDELFNPSTKYPEGLNLDIKSDPRIYDEVRNLLIEMNLDKKNIGKKNWNPFGDYVKKNNKVVIKPNLVKHINASKDGNTDSLITNFAIIRPIIDYVLIALKNTGSLVVGDAPVQECDFKQVIQVNNLEEGINVYKNKGYNIKLSDFRQHQNANAKSVLVDLSNDSEFIEVDNLCDKYAITNYNLKYMREHHNASKHEYLIAKDILDADVIINLPKPKVHRKAGMTACLKNFIGVNTKKEYIPHHRNGNVSSGGDEFPEHSLVKKMESKVKNYSYTKNIFLKYIRKGLNGVLKISKKDRYMEGSWYGNDTIWRSILDINKIVNYANKKGNMQNEKQRIVLNIADMIISGEKEGPLIPSNKEVGMLVASFNSLNMDSVICSIMGFETNKIKYILNGYKISKYSLSNGKYDIYCEGKKVKDIEKYNHRFIPTDGWYDYLYKDVN